MKKLSLFLLPLFFLACQSEEQSKELKYRQGQVYRTETSRNQKQEQYQEKKYSNNVYDESQVQLSQYYQSYQSDVSNYQRQTSSRNERETFEPDDNWDYYEIRNWFLFPSANIAIRKDVSLDSVVENDKIYLSLNCEFRALKEKVSIMPYHDFWLAGQGGLSDVAYPGVQASPRAYKEWAQMWVGDFEGASVYEKLNNLPRGTAASDVVEVGSSRYATARRKVPFLAAEILTVGYHIQENADIGHFIPIIKGPFYLGQRFNKDSVQIGAKHWRPYQFLRPRKKAGKNSLRNRNESLEKKLIGKWQLIDCASEHTLKKLQKGLELFLTFTEDGKIIEEAVYPQEQICETTKISEYRLRGNDIIYLSDEETDVYITSENDYLIVEYFPRGTWWFKFKKQNY